MDPNKLATTEGQHSIRRLSDAEAARIAKQGGLELVTGSPEKAPPQNESDAAKERNKAKAREELGHIESLWNHSSFVWFYNECIENGFKAARKFLHEVDVGDSELPRLASRFHVFKEIACWLDEREREHRRLQDPSDPKISEINERLDAHS
jgi:hypothetical protein